MGSTTTEEKKKKKFRLFGRSRRAAAASSKKSADSDKPTTTETSGVAPKQPLPRVVKVSSARSTSRNGAVVSTSKPTEKKTPKPSWLARRPFFKKMTNQAFELVDADGSGTVDEKELYAGLLLIHLRLGTYAGPAACKPVDRQRVHDIFHKMDVDNSGSLDRDEFREVMMILFSNVLLRVVAQWSMTLMIVPIIAQYILDGIYFLWHCAIHLVQELDEHSFIFDAIEVSIERMRDAIVTKIPTVIKSMASKVGYVLEKVPDSVWDSVPLTLLSVILGSLAVPWLLFRIDDYFQKVAEKKEKEAE